MHGPASMQTESFATSTCEPQIQSSNRKNRYNIYFYATSPGAQSFTRLLNRPKSQIYASHPSIQQPSVHTSFPFLSFPFLLDATFPLIFSRHSNHMFPNPSHLNTINAPLLEMTVAYPGAMTCLYLIPDRAKTLYQKRTRNGEKQQKRCDR